MREVDLCDQFAQAGWIKGQNEFKEDIRHFIQRAFDGRNAFNERLRIVPLVGVDFVDGGVGKNLDADVGIQPHRFLRNARAGLAVNGVHG